MINNLSELYLTVSQKLPGVSTPILDTEFRRAEREACREAGIWSKDIAFTAEEDTYTYSLALPTNSDLVLCLKLWDTTNDKKVDVNSYEVSFDEATATAGYELTDASSTTEAGLEGLFVDSGDTYMGAAVYQNDLFAMFKAVEGVDDLSSLYVVTTITDYDNLVLDPTDFPNNYYAILPPVSSFSGVLGGQGDYTGTVRSNSLSSQAAGVLELAPRLVDGRDYPLDAITYTATLTLMPRTGFSAAPDTVLTQYSELITEKALTRLYEYPPNFPWANQNAAAKSEYRARKLVALAKNERYKGMRRTSVTMRAPYGFI